MGGTTSPVDTVDVVLYVDGNVLLQRRTLDATRYPKKWNMFGGGIELGEMPQEAAVREIEEEIGLTLATEDLKLIGTMQMAANAPLMHYFSVPLTVPLSSIRLAEGSGFALFGLEDLANLDLAPEAALALRRFYDSEGFGWVDSRGTSSSLDP